MKKFKKIIAICMALTVIFAFSSTAVAAGSFHKVNGMGSPNGNSVQYTSQTTKTCSKITAKGTSDTGWKSVTIMVQSSSGKVVATKAVTLNGKEQTLVNFHTKYLTPDIYTITVSSKDTVPYEVSTYFYE